MRYFSFELGMPCNNSWNGKWSGEGKQYLKADKMSERYYKNIDRELPGVYTYSFGDGWVASITVKEITQSEYNKIKRAKNSFCGYEWMIESIVYRGEIRVS